MVSPRPVHRRSPVPAPGPARPRGEQELPAPKRGNPASPSPVPRDPEATGSPHIRKSPPVPGLSIPIRSRAPPCLTLHSPVLPNPSLGLGSSSPIAAPSPRPSVPHPSTRSCSSCPPPAFPLADAGAHFPPSLVLCLEVDPAEVTPQPHPGPFQNELARAATQPATAQSAQCVGRARALGSSHHGIPDKQLLLGKALSL